MKGWINKRIKRWINEKLNVWMNGWINERTNKRMNEWSLNEWMNEWMNEEWMNEWVYLTVSPSRLDIESVLSSEPRANRFPELQAPHVIALLCFPRQSVNQSTIFSQ